MEKIIIDIKYWYIVVAIDLRTVSLLCKEVKEELDTNNIKSFVRIYDFPSKEEVKSTELIGEYLYVTFNDKTNLQIKLQSTSEIILDYFTSEGELIHEVGAWDFWDC